MNKQEHLKAVKYFLRKVLQHRKNLYNNRRSRKPETVEMARNMEEIRYQVGNIKSFDQMQKWINQKGVRQRVFQVIPSTYQKWRDEYDLLVTRGKILQGVIVRAKQMEMNF